MRTLRLLVEAAGRGEGGALVVLGERGSGRTAIVAQAASAASGFVVLSSGGSPGEADIPGACLHRLLRPVRGDLAGLASHHAEALRAVTEGRSPEPPHAATHGRGAAASPEGPVHDPGTPTTALPAGQSGDPLTLPAAVLELLALVAPVICLVDDVDTVDSASLGALAFAARRLAGLPVVMVFVARDPVGMLAGLPTMTLRALPRPDARALLDELPGQPLRPEVAGALIGLADGNPLALRELAEDLRPEQRRGHAPLPRTLPAGSRLRRALRAEVDQLPEPVRRLVLCAAADPELTVAELSRPRPVNGPGVSPAGPGDLGAATAFAAEHAGDAATLEAAERAGLLRVAGDRLEFRPALLRHVAYHGATVAERRTAHEHLARVVRDPRRRSLHLAALAAGPDEALAGRLAAHARHAPPAAAADALEAAARLSARPAGYLVAAARQAFRAGRPWRSRLLLRQVTAVPDGLRPEVDLLAAELDDPPQPHQLVAAATALGERDRGRALDGLVAAADAMSVSGDYRGLPALARQAVAMRRSGDPAGTELLTEYLIGSAALFRGDYQGAAGPLRRVRALAVRLDAHPALTRACAAAFLLGHDDEARSLGDRASMVARANGDAHTVPLAMEFAAGARFALGRHDEAAAELRESADLARESGQPALAGGSLALLAVLAAVHGDPATARLRVREARRDGAAAPDGRGWALGDWALATVDLLAGRHREATRRMAPLMSAGHLIVRVAATPFAVEAAVRAGETRFARRLIEDFDRWAPRTGNPDWIALSARCHALVTGDDDHFERALDAHARGSSEFERARTELLYGSLLRRGRRPIRAREHLRSALDAFQRLDCGWWASRVAAELRAAGDVPASPRGAPGRALTPQQTQIAELVAAGATNREVAAMLFLSPRTVDHHLRNIFARLGIRSRVDLARIMA